MKIKRLPNLDGGWHFPDIGNNIKKARLECGMSQKELAIQIGLKTAVSISLIEANKRKVSSQVLGIISSVTNLPIEYFYK